jgi:alpha-D-ribose 1-methylphosphonate 5-triphosphate synthase subunit PhnL
MHSTNDPAIRIRNLRKTFTLHNQGGVEIPVFDGIDLDVQSGECVVLHGPSGAGKSTLLRSLYANYRPQAGRVEMRHDGAMIDILAAEPRLVLEIRRRTLGYVSQFLRVIPRVPARDIVAEPLRALGVAADEAQARAAALLERLNIPERLWSLPPATFSGGEQQRVNIAHGFVAEKPILLLDEPTASLDAANRAVVLGLIDEALARGAAVVGIFHDAEVRERVATRVFELAPAGTQAA